MLLDEVADLLATGGLGTVGSTADYGIYKAVMPDAPEKAVALYETGGAPSPDGRNFSASQRKM